MREMTPDDVSKRMWPAHKMYHSLKHKSKEEDRRRLMFFKDNHTFIEQFNQPQKKTHNCKHNNFSHWSFEEYESWLSHSARKVDSKTIEKIQQKPIYMVSKENINSIPRHVDWREEGKVTRVKHQGGCGSCYAFSCVGAIESAYAIKNNILIDFSEQQIVDCSKKSFGCFGGSLEGGFEYVMEHGLMKSDDYPYMGKKECCKYNPKNVIKISDYEPVEANELSLMMAVAEKGPISIAINASSRSFQFYNSGVFYDPDASSTNINHALLCIGYGQIDDENFWQVKNSWGTSWGDAGYINIARNGNNYLGVTTNACYPIL